MFNRKLFNPLYWHVKEAFEDEGVRFIWLYGGSSASKTYTAVQALIIEMLNGKDNNALVLRKFHVDIKDSIFADFKNIITKWKLESVFVIQQDYIKCKTGSYVRFRGLDDSEKVKGITGFKRVVLEEVSQFDEIDFKQIKKRLRGQAGQQIIGIFNPIVEEHWIKVNVFDKELLTEIQCDLTGKWENDTGNTVIMKTTYLDNHYIVGDQFIDQHVIDDMEKDKLNDYAYYCVYGLGNWGRIRTGGEFWKDFNPNIHVKPIKYNPELPLHISWDENVNPYLTCEVWQGDGKSVWQIDEIFLSDPRNRIKNVCAEFKARYPVAKGLFVYGDKTSVKEDTKLEKGENFFTEILLILKDYHPRLRLPTVNPAVVQSAGFVNQIYSGRIEGLSITISDKCKLSIQDYTYALEDSDGTLKKTKKKNPVTEVTYEEFGHASDAKRYFLTQYFVSEYNEYKRGGKRSEFAMGKTETHHGY